MGNQNVGQDSHQRLSFQNKTFESVANQSHASSSGESSVDDFNQYLQKYRFIDKTVHELFGDILIMEIIEQKVIVAARQFFYQTETQYKKQYKSYKKIKQKPFKNIVKLIDMTKRTDSKLFCSSNYRIIIVCEFMTNNFRSEIQKRNKPKRTFSATNSSKGNNLQQRVESNEKSFFEPHQALYIAKSLIAALTFFQINKRKHEYVTTSSIFLQDNNTVKICDPFLFSLAPAYFYIGCGKNIEGVYLAPEVMENLQRTQRKQFPNNESYQFDAYKADVFSLGCVLLQILLLQNLDSLFDYKFFKIHFSQLQENIEKVKEKYGEFFSNLISMMTIAELDQRPDFVLIAKQLGILQKQQDVENELIISAENLWSDFKNKTFQTSSFVIPQQLKLNDGNLNHIINNNNNNSEKNTPNNNINYNSNLQTLLVPPEALVRNDNILTPNLNITNYVPFTQFQGNQILIENQPPPIREYRMLPNQPFQIQDQQQKNGLINNAVTIQSDIQNMKYPQSHHSEKSKSPSIQNENRNLTPQRVLETRPNVNNRINPNNSNSNNQTCITNNKISNSGIKNNLHNHFEQMPTNNNRISNNNLKQNNAQQADQSSLSSIEANQILNENSQILFSTDNFNSKSPQYVSENHQIGDESTSNQKTQIQSSVSPNKKPNGSQSRSPLKGTPIQFGLQQSKSLKQFSIRSKTTENQSKNSSNNQSHSNIQVSEYINRLNYQSKRSTKTLNSNNSNNSPIQKLNSIIKRIEEKEPSNQYERNSLMNQLNITPPKTLKYSKGHNQIYHQNKEESSFLEERKSFQKDKQKPTNKINKPDVKMNPPNMQQFPFHIHLHSERSDISKQSEIIPISSNQTTVHQNQREISENGSFINNISQNEQTTRFIYKSNKINEIIRECKQESARAQYFHHHHQSNNNSKQRVHTPLKQSEQKNQADVRERNITQDSASQNYNYQSPFKKEKLQHKKSNQKNSGLQLSEYIRCSQSQNQNKQNQVQEPSKKVNQLKPNIQETSKTEPFQDHSFYQGGIQNGLRNGHGQFVYNDGGYYEGQWKDGFMKGFGRLYYPSGNLAFEGEWENDKFNGHGIMYNEHPELSQEPFDFRDFNKLGERWVQFEGEFAQDSKQGFGTLYLSNKEVFIGKFVCDIIDGRGLFQTMQGKEIQGLWHQNQFISL